MRNIETNEKMENIDITEKLIKNDGEVRFNTGYGWVTEDVAIWLKNNGIFNYETMCFFSENIIQNDKMDEDGIKTKKACVGSNALNWEVNTNKKLLAEYYQSLTEDQKYTDNTKTKVRGIDWDLMIKYIKLNYNFDKIKSQYKIFKKITSI